MMASAQLQGNGYYRVYNVGLNSLKGKKAYTWVSDDKVNINTNSGTAQSFEQLALWPADVYSPMSEPSTVVYAKINGGNLDLESQGTSVSRMTNMPLYLQQNGSANSYTLSVNKSGVTLYLWANATAMLKHHVTTTKENRNVAYKYWAVEPVSSSSDNYFGVKPIFEVGGKYYAPFYASFPFKFASAGMKAYYVNSVSNENFTLEEITTEVKPGATPMLIECSSPNVSDNRLDLLYGSYPAIKDNKLSGVYFCNDFITSNPNCRVTFDPASMRVWNVENGQLVLSTATDHLHTSALYGKREGQLANGYLNANHSYMKVSAAAKSTLTLGTTGVNDVQDSAEAAQIVGYTTVGGVKIAAPVKGMGMVVVKYSDGTARTVVY